MNKAQFLQTSRNIYNCFSTAVGHKYGVDLMKDIERYDHILSTAILESETAKKHVVDYLEPILGSAEKLHFSPYRVQSKGSFQLFCQEAIHSFSSLEWPIQAYWTNEIREHDEKLARLLGEVDKVQLGILKYLRSRKEKKVV